MKIIFYDGNCPMCNGWVKRLIRWDKRKQFRFSPLEGELAKTTLTSLLPDYIQEDTIVFFDEGQVYVRSDAAIKISETLGFPFNIGKVGQSCQKDGGMELIGGWPTEDIDSGSDMMPVRSLHRNGETDLFKNKK